MEIFRKEILAQIPEVLPIGLIVVMSKSGPAYINAWVAEKTSTESGEIDMAILQKTLPESIEIAEKFFKKSKNTITDRCYLHGVPHKMEASLLQNGPGARSGGCLIKIENEGGSPYNNAYQNLHSQELNAIFELSSDGILICDSEGQVIKINEASKKLNGWLASEIVGRNVRDLVRDQLIDKSVSLRVLKTRQKVNMMQYIHTTGKHLLVTGTPLFGKDGAVKLVVVNERDMTQLNAIKKQLEETQQVSEKYKDNLAELAVLESRQGKIIAESQLMVQVIQYAMKLARLDASDILLTGESGVGKGMLAKFIHDHGQRRGKPFIQVNCAALPEGLLEAELFGYEKGAFTGAQASGKAGLFELAHNGTLFLDEVGDCPLVIQAKLLKYLDDHEILRLGGVKPKLIDCTIIAATNRDLTAHIKQNKFRSDLFYRLNTFAVHIPPLRDRPEDVFELIMQFLDDFNLRYGFTKKISSNALHILQNYHYPGNVRELRNIIKQAVVMEESDVIDSSILDDLDAVTHPSDRWPADRKKAPNLTEQLEIYERQILEKALARAKSTRELAKNLGTSQTTVVRRLKKYGLQAPSIPK